MFAGSCAGIFYSFSPETGEPFWTYDIKNDGRQTSFHGNMLFTDGLVLIGSDLGEGHIYAFETESGVVRWKFRADRGVPSDIIRVGDSIFGVTLDDTLLCLDLQTGGENWRFGTVSAPPDEFAMASTPTSDGERVYFGGRNGILYSFDVVTGEMEWSSQIGDEITTPILQQDGSLYAGTADGHIVRVDPISGVILADLQVGRLRGPLVPTGNSIIAYRVLDDWDGDLVSVDFALEKIRWEAIAPDGKHWPTARPMILGPWILAGTRSGTIHAINALDGTIEWSQDVDPGREWSENDGVRVFGRHETRLFVGTIGGMMYAFEMADSILPVEPESP